MEKFVLETLLALFVTGVLYLLFSLLPAFDWHCVLLFLIVRHLVAEKHSADRSDRSDLSDPSSLRYAAASPSDKK